MGHILLSPQTDKNVQLCGMKGPLTATFARRGSWHRARLGPGAAAPSLMI
ncbi:MAG: hypothetical protein IPK28_10915 [Devosia sp.]|nr:hypothetical protein [Devosia sp.]